jgi:predicted nicotinamide N-methyase
VTSRAECEARVREHAVTARPWLCPEVAMRLITHECPLWYRSEDDVHAMGWETPFWAFAWPGGQSLARHLLDHPSIVAGKTVLDFGAGGAVEGIAARMAGARRVIASDIDPVAAVAMEVNAALNGVSLEVTTDDLIGRDDPAWEVVLAGDMFYDAELSARALDWLAALARRGAVVLLGDPGRGNIPEARVEAVAWYEAPFDTDVRGLHLRKTLVGRVIL